MRRFQSAILVLLVLLMPLRGMAAATMGLLPAGSQDEAVHAEAGCHHEGETQSGSDTGPRCGTCAEHGCCASFLAPAAAGASPALAGAARIRLGEQFAAGFVPEHLDPPPLAR
jgi:hypothetical protein